MKFIKNLIANVVFYVGYGIMNVGVKLHKLLNTETGKRMKLLDQFQRELAKELMAEAQQVGNPSSGAFYVSSGKGSKEVH